MRHAKIEWTDHMIRDLIEMDDRKMRILDIAKHLGVGREFVGSKLRQMGRGRGFVRTRGRAWMERMFWHDADRTSCPLPPFHPIARAVLAEAGLIF